MGELVEIRDRLRQFSADRDWEQYHQPHALLLALVGEVGEVAELVQWISPEQISEWIAGSENRERMSNELADVLAYLVQLADKFGIDLAKAVDRKIALNGERYPVELSRGTAEKYDRL